MCGGNQALLITCPIQSQQWSMVVAASCCGGVFQLQGQDDWLQSRERWMRPSTGISWTKTFSRVLRTSDWAEGLPSNKTMGLIYETNVRPKFGRTVVSTQNLEFINMDVSGGYDQISRQVWARVRKFLSQPELACSTENFKELYKWQHFVHLDYFPKPTNKAFFFFFLSGL